MNEETRAKLKQVSCATLTTVLYKRGLRNVFLQNVGPVGGATRDTDANMVGPAFTLRYIPAREDLNPLSIFQDPKHPQRVAIETCPEGYVMVIDSRQDPSAASSGDILIRRLMKRGGAGIVTDGGFRDSPTIAGLDIPAYHQRPSSPTNLTKHQAIEFDTPIGCGGVPVFPGDIIVGDGEGVVVIPQDIADEVAEEATEMTLFENFVTEKVMEGRGIIGLYPPTLDETKVEFEQWKSQQS